MIKKILYYLILANIWKFRSQKRKKRSQKMIKVYNNNQINRFKERKSITLNIKIALNLIICIMLDKIMDLYWENYSNTKRLLKLALILIAIKVLLKSRSLIINQSHKNNINKFKVLLFLKIENLKIKKIIHFLEKQIKIFSLKTNM